MAIPWQQSHQFSVRQLLVSYTVAPHQSGSMCTKQLSRRQAVLCQLSGHSCAKRTCQRTSDLGAKQLILSEPTTPELSSYSCWLSQFLWAKLSTYSWLVIFCYLSYSTIGYLPTDWPTQVYWYDITYMGPHWLVHSTWSTYTMGWSMVYESKVLLYVLTYN